MHAITIPIMLVGLSLLGALLGYVAAVLSPGRTFKQFVPYDYSIEKRVIDAIRHSPELLDHCPIPVEHFAHEPHRAFMEGLSTTTAAPTKAQRKLVPATFRKDASTLAALHSNREIDGAVPLLYAPNEEVAVYRERRPVTRSRTLWGVLAGGVWGACIATIQYEQAIPQYVAALALLLFLIPSLVCVFVDLDTLYLDQPFFSLGIVCSSAFAIFGALHVHTIHEIGTTLLFSYGFVMMMFSFSLLYGLIRGLGVALGFGDALIMAATLSITSLLTGSMAVGVIGIGVGFVLQIVFSIIISVRRKSRLNAHVAAIPCLLLGPAIAWVVLSHLAIATLPLTDVVTHIQAGA
jgi:hypothetical protein